MERDGRFVTKHNAKAPHNGGAPLGSPTQPRQEHTGAGKAKPQSQWRRGPWGIHDIAAHFMVSRETVDNWRKHPKFPAPVAHINRGHNPVWERVEVMAWHWDNKPQRNRNKLAQAMLKRFREGATIVAIHRELGVHEDTIRKTLREIGELPDKTQRGKDT